MQDSLFGDDRADTLARAFQALTWEIHGIVYHWPADDEKDRALAADLLRQSSERDIVAKLAGWPKWMREHADEIQKEVNPRGRIRTWCLYRDRFPEGNARSRAHQRTTGSIRPGRAGSLTGGAPAAPGTFRQSGAVSF